jgi:hypothetical protein
MASRSSGDGQGLANRRRSIFLSNSTAAQTDLPCRGREQAALRATNLATNFE